MKKAIIFPGQGSQSVGMGADLVGAIPACKELFERADAFLGYELSKICFEGPQEELNKSNHAQLGIFVTSAACYEALKLKQPDVTFDIMAGHSLGEWTALYAAGAVSFEDALKVLKARGEFMQAACEENPGAMLAVMNLSADVLDGIAKDAGCNVANYNSLAQIVLSGTVESIDIAEGLVKGAGAKRAIRLPVAGAFHSPLMQPAADKMAEFLTSIEFSAMNTAVMSNVTAQPHTVEFLSENMVRQITSSVQWIASVQWLASQGVQDMVECGPGKVLSGLIKRIDKGVNVLNIGALSDLEK